MNYKKFIRLSNICTTDLKTKKECLLNLIGMIARNGKISQTNELENSIFYREKLMTTGIGLGIGIPHIRSALVQEPVIAVLVNPNGIPDYQSLDNSLIKIVFMIIVPENQHKLHVKILSEIITKLKTGNNLNRLVYAEKKAEIFKILNEE